MLKKNYDHKYLILSRSTIQSNNLYKNNSFFSEVNFNNIDTEPLSIKNSDFIDVEYKNMSESFFFSNENLGPNFNKTMDFKRNYRALLLKNRKLLRNILNLKIKRQYRLDKYFCKIIKNKGIDFLMGLEYKLCDILLKSQFFCNHTDCFWFIKNGYISVNGFVCFNPKKILSTSDVITLNFDKNYYYFYRSNLNQSIKFVSKFNNLLWRINKNIYSDKYSDKKIELNDKLPNWIFNAMYFRNDIPKFIEVDFKTMSIIILKKFHERNSFDYYNTKFFNFYFTRTYNWKTII